MTIMDVRYNAHDEMMAMCVIAHDTIIHAS